MEKKEEKNVKSHAAEIVVTVCIYYVWCTLQYIVSRAIHLIPISLYVHIFMLMYIYLRDSTHIDV